MNSERSPEFAWTDFSVTFYIIVAVFMTLRFNNNNNNNNLFSFI
jgi:hypothetical protein